MMAGCAMIDMARLWEYCSFGNAGANVKWKKGIFMTDISPPLSCPVCGEAVKPAWRICPVCESRLKASFCPLCGIAVKENWGRCPECEAVLVCPECG